MVHDLNNLLTSVVSYTAIVLSELPDDDPLRKDLQEIEGAADRASSLTRLLLTVRCEAFRRDQAQLARPPDPEAFGKLFRGVVHDMDISLTLIEDYCGLLFDRLTADGPTRADVVRIEQAAVRAVSLTHLLQTVGHGAASQPKVLSLNSVIVDMEQEIRCLIGRGIELVTVLDPSLGQVEIDPLHIARVIMNLVLNARDAMPGGGRLTIETASAEESSEQPGILASMGRGPYAVLSVSDTGCGMDEETLSHLFEPFYTTKESNKGLGLFTVHGIVAESGGHVKVCSQPGCGSTFRIYLPAA
jgi:signal transduction histidine kinase